MRLATLSVHIFILWPVTDVRFFAAPADPLQAATCLLNQHVHPVSHSETRLCPPPSLSSCMKPPLPTASSNPWPTATDPPRHITLKPN